MPEELEPIQPQGELTTDDFLRELVRQDLGKSKVVENNLRDFVRNDLKQRGYYVVGELPTMEEFEYLKKQKAEESKRRLADVQKYVYEAMAEPNFFQQIKDISTKILKGDMTTSQVASWLARGAVKRLSFGNLDIEKAIPDLMEKITGKKGLANAYKNLRRKEMKAALGYWPEDAIGMIEKFGEAGGMFIAYSALLRGAAGAAKGLTDIPILRATATGEIAGILSGLLRKPEREGVLNRLKQIPGDVLFFTIFETGILSLGQIAKIINWNKKWKAIAKTPGVEYTVDDVKNLYRKMNANTGGHPETYGPLTTKEKTMVDLISGEQGWSNAIKNGWIKKPPEIPRKPKFTDIFRREGVQIPGEEVPPRAEREAPPREAPPPKEPPPTAEAPPPEPGAPPVKAGVKPPPGRGPAYEFTGEIPKRPPRPFELPPHIKKKVAKARKARKGQQYPVGMSKHAPQIWRDAWDITSGRGIRPYIDPVTGKWMELEDFRSSIPKPLRRMDKGAFPVDEVTDMLGLEDENSLYDALEWSGKPPAPEKELSELEDEARAFNEEFKVKKDTLREEIAKEKELEVEEAFEVREELPPSFKPVEKLTAEELVVEKNRLEQLKTDYTERIKVIGEERIAEKLLQRQPLEERLRATEEKLSAIEKRIEKEVPTEKPIAEVREERDIFGKVVVEGKPYDKVLYRGISAEKPIDEGLYGKGTYFSNSETYSARYGRLVTKRVVLKKPFITKPSEIEELGREAGEKARKEGKGQAEQLEAISLSIREKLEAQGYDGIVIKGQVGEFVSTAVKKPEAYEEVVVFDPSVSVKDVKAPKAPEPELFKPEKVEVKFPSGFDSHGLRKLKDVNKAREVAQFYVDRGWKLEVGQTTDNKAWIRLTEKGTPGEGTLKYIPKKVKPEFLKKPEVELRIPEEKPKIVAEGKPALDVTKVLNDIAKTDRRLKIDDIRAAMEDELLTRYDPSIGPPENYIRRILNKRYWPSGELKKAPRETVLTEEKVPVEERGPEDIFADAQEEARVRKMFEDVAENDRDLDILNSRVFKGLESYQSIADRHGVSRELINKRFWELANKLQGNKDFQNIVKKQMKQMNLGPVPSKQDLKDLKDMINKYFTTTKGVAKNIDLANDKRIGSKIAEIFDASTDAKDMRKFLRQNKNVALDDFVYDVLTGETDVANTTLPDNIKTTFKRMRARIDNLTQLVISEGALTDQTKAVFERNIGRYLAKYYRIYEQKHWSPPKDVRDRFASLLKRKYPSTFGQFTEVEMDAYLDAMLRKRDFVYRPASGRAKRIPTGHFIKRKQLDQAFRDFAGEVADPVWLYLKTVSDQATMGYNAEFLNKVANEYPDLWTADKTVANSRGWQEHQLPKSYGYGKLRGKYVSPELDTYIRREISPTLSGFDRVVSKFIMNPFKASKTMGSIPTHARNFLGNVMFSMIMRNNILNPVNWPYYYDALEVYLTKSSTGKEAWLDMIKRGVTETQFYGSEIPKVFKDLLRLDPPEWPEKILNAMVKHPIDKIGKLYNFEDMLYRIAADIKNRKHFKMSGAESVEEINRGMTNYRKLPLAAEILRRYTLFGPFISFKWNVGKIVVNQATRGAKEVAEKGTRKRGIGRLLTLAFVLGLPSIIKEVSERILEDHYGIDQEIIKEFEENLPSYRRHGSFVYYIHDGKLKAFDLTYIWPTGEFERAIKAALKGDVKSFTEAVSLFVHPIFDIYSILVRGKDPYWDTDLPITKSWLKDGVNRIAEIAKSIYLPASTPLPSFKGLLKGDLVPGKLTGYQLKNIIDAYNQKVDRYGRVKSLPEEVKNFFTGLRTWNVEPDKLLLQSVRALEWERIEIANQFKSWLRSNASAPAWQIKDKKDTMFKAVEKVNKRIQGATDVYKKIKKLIKEGKL